MYQSPIDVIYKQMRTQFEDNVYKAIQDYGVVVDRDELIKALQYDRDQYDKGFADGLLYKEDKWISVEERLPTECENVLCFEDGKAYVAFLEKAEYSAIWWDWVDYDRDDTWTERKPTHWMPLPEPPKMKGEANE